MNSIRLNNGVMMPVIGLGTYPMNGYKLAFIIRTAMKLGYFSFDTSTSYRNEKWIGIGLKLCLKNRKNFFITTKLSNANQRDGNIRAALLSSLSRLKLKYLDLYLMHWPHPKHFIKSWQEMEELYEEGLVRAIGVCNFHEEHLSRLLKFAKIIPAVNQVELHPLLSQSDLVEFCKSKNIILEAYSPLARMHEKLIENDELIRIAQKYNKSVPQIILRWGVQHDFVVIPKSSNVQRLEQNISIFDFNLTSKDMLVIDNLNENLRVRFHPDNYNYDK